MITFRRFVFISLIVPLLASCSKKQDKYNSFIHYALGGQVRNLDPATTGDVYSMLVVSQIYESLFQYAYLKRPLEVEPLLAEGMPRISKDFLTYTMTLKKGISFQDDPCFKSSGGKGRELTADDVVFSWKRLADPTTNSDMIWVRHIRGIPEWTDDIVKHQGAADYTRPIDGLKALDRYTVRLKLVKPFPQLIFDLANHASAIVPREAVEYYGADFNSHPVGTGPYVFKEWSRHFQIVLVKNPNFHQETYPTEGEGADKDTGLLADAGAKLPLNDGIVFTDGGEISTHFLNFRKGNFDFIDVPKDYFESVLEGDHLSPSWAALGMTLGKWIEPSNFHFFFNMEDPVWGRKNSFIRKAIEHALDVNKIIQVFRGGAAVSANGPIPHGLLGFDPDYKNSNQTYDLALAKEFLKKAGYPGGKGLPDLVYEMASATDRRQFAEYFRGQMSLIGINVKIIEDTWPAFVDKLFKGNYQILSASSQGGSPDGEDYMITYYSKNISPGPNRTRYSNAQYDSLVEKTSLMPPGPARDRLFRQMLTILNDDVPSIFIYNNKSYTLTHGWLKNFKHNAMVHNDVKYYRVDLALKKRLKNKL